MAYVHVNTPIIIIDSPVVILLVILVAINRRLHCAKCDIPGYLFHPLLKWGHDGEEKNRGKETEHPRDMSDPRSRKGRGRI